MKDLLPLALAIVLVPILAVLYLMYATGGLHFAGVSHTVLVSGVINPAVTQSNIKSTICVSGWTATIRPPVTYTTALKIKQMKQWNLSGATSAYEEDHLISLELGGNPTDPNNLWPQPYTTTPSDYGAKTKDSVENFLHKQICTGTITLAQAQKEIATDWHAVLSQMKTKSFGAVDTTDPDDEVQ